MYDSVVAKIRPVRVKNGCCKDKPFILYAVDNGVYYCECECGAWCTTGWKTPAEAIMQYEIMSSSKHRPGDSCFMPSETLFKRYRNEREAE